MTSEMGPIDYLLVEWPGRQPNGEVAPHLVDLVDRGLIRILDLAFIAKDEDGTVAGSSSPTSAAKSPSWRSSRAPPRACSPTTTSTEAGDALEPGTSAALLVFENTWAAPFAGAVRRSGGELVASGRIPSEASSPRSTRPRPTLREEQSMPGLLRGMARTAVIAGTATSVSNRVSKRQGQRWAEQEEQAAAGRRRRRPRRRRPRRPAASSMIDQLKELGELKAQGILTEEEFAAQKAKLLGS